MSAAAQALKHVFDIDMRHCSKCSDKLKIIAAILEPGAAGDREDPSCTWVCRPVRHRVLLPVGVAAAPVQATRPRWSRLRPRVCGIDGSGRVTRDNPQTAPKQDDSRRRRHRSTELSHLQNRLTRVACRGLGAMGKEKGRLKTLSSTPTSGRPLIAVPIQASQRGPHHSGDAAFGDSAVPAVARQQPHRQSLGSSPERSSLSATSEGSSGGRTNILASDERMAMHSSTEIIAVRRLVKNPT